MPMPDKRVLVTGASRGIGRAISARLASDGWQVALHYAFDDTEAQKTQQMLGSKCVGFYKADLSQTGAATKLFAQARKDGPIHAVVNNAGVYMPIDFAKSGDAAFAANLHKTFMTNFESPLMLCRAAVKEFLNTGGGKIVNVASRVGFKGESGAALYGASKAALINLTRSLAVELATKKVQVYAIAPGWVDTAMAREGMQERLDDILSGIPLGRMARPEDCAGAVSFLLSNDAEYLSGIAIDINGASYFH